MEDTQAFKYSQQPIVNWVKIRTAAMEPGKYMDITSLVEQFNIHEDILSPFLNGDITIVDGLSMVSKLPIIGQERIAISFRSSFNKETKVVEFDVYRVSRIDENADDKSQMYTLFLSSPEFIENKKRKVSQSFEDQHDVIVEKIYNNYLKTEDYDYSFEGGKPIRIPEKCEDNDRVVFPTWNPIRAINWIAQKARSSFNTRECTYLFFERMGEGFYFMPLTGLSQKQTQFKYFRASPQYATVDGQKDVVLPILSINDYVVENDHNVIESMNQGRYLSSLNYYDAFTREYGTRTYSLNRDYDNVRHVEVSQPTNNLNIPNYTSASASLSYSPRNTQRIDDIPDYSIDVALKRNAQLSQFKEHLVRVSVPGNSNIHAGDVIQLEIPSKDAPRDERKTIDQSVSGRYIIQSVRHRVVMNNEYTSYLTLIRDSVPVQYPDQQTITNLETEDNTTREL